MTDYELRSRAGRLEAGIAQSGDRCDGATVTAFPKNADGEYVVSVFLDGIWVERLRDTDAQTAVLSVLAIIESSRHDPD